MGSKLDRNNVEDIIPLTSMQEGMLFHYLTELDSPEYHEQVIIGLIGDLNPDLFQKAWDFVILRNEMLRTVYRWEDMNKPVQVILKNYEVIMRQYDFSKEADKEKSLEELVQIDLKNRIDLKTETLRIYLCKYAEEEHTMVLRAYPTLTKYAIL